MTSSPWRTSSRRGGIDSADADGVGCRTPSDHEDIGAGQHHAALAGFRDEVLAPPGFRQLQPEMLADRRHGDHRAVAQDFLRHGVAYQALAALGVGEAVGAAVLDPAARQFAHQRRDRVVERPHGAFQPGHQA